MEPAVPKKKRSSVPAHATSCKTSKVPGEDCVCFLCHDGGTLVMCDRRQCPKAYHPECVGRNLAFFKTKGAWLCARHFCSKCSKQPCTYCVMCPNSFCLKCLSSMRTEVFLPLSEAAGLCETCMRLVKMIELQCTIDGMAVNCKDSGTMEFLFKEYWLLMKGFHGYNLMDYAPSEATPPPSGSSDSIKTDTMPSMGVERISDHRPIWKATAPLQITATEPSPTKETVSVPRNVRVLIKRRSTKNDSNFPAKKKIRVLKLLNDSSSDNEEMNKPLSSMICVGKQKVNSACKPLPVSAEITAPPLFAKAFDDLGKPFAVSNSSSPSKGLLVIGDSSQALGVAASTSPPLLPKVLPFMDTLRPVISPPPLRADTCKLPGDRNLCKKASNSKVSSKSKSPNLKLVNDDHVSAKKSPGSTKMASPTPRPGSTLASTGKPLPIEVDPSALSAAKASPSPSIVSCKPLIIKRYSLKTLASEPSQLYQDTSSDKLFNASSDCKESSLKANTVLPSKRSHEEACSSVGATPSTFNKAETLAPINVQNVSPIYLRRSHLEELLSNHRFTLLVLGAFVRIRNSKLGNNYRLVQIAGTTLQAKYYQAGERKTNVVLEVLNLNTRQRIRIDHVSNSMFTEEECQRLQQSVELGFINAPTVRALAEKAVALQKAKANKCLDEKPASESQPRESGLLDKELRIFLDEGRKIPASPHHSVKLHTRTQEDCGKQVEADQESASLELATTIAERGEIALHEADIATALTVNSGAGEERPSIFFQEKRHSECWNSGMNEYLKREHQDNLTTEIPNKAHDGRIVFDEAQVAAEKQLDADQHSDISVEMTTVNAGKGQRKMHSTQSLTPLVGQTCPEDEAELTLPQRTQQKGYQVFGSDKYCMKEQQTSPLAEAMHQAQGDGPIEAHSETQVFLSKQMDTSQHYDISLANNIGKTEAKMHAAKISSTSAVKVATLDELASNLPQGMLQTEPQGYGTNNHPVEKHDTGVMCEIENEPKGDGCGEEYIPTVGSEKGVMDSVQWFYQDLKGTAFGPFSLEQLRKWNRTGAFPPDLKIWSEVAGRRLFIFLTDALNAHEMEVCVGMGTEKCPAEDCCLDPRSQREDSCTESGSTCHRLVKEMFGDRGTSTSRIGWQSTSAHTEQRLDSSISLEGDWTSPREKGKLNLVTSPKSMKDASGKRCQNETSSNWKDPVINKESALNAPMKINTDSSWEFHILEKETLSEGEREGKSSLAHTLAKGTSAEEEREGKSSLTHILANETSGEGEIEGKCSPSCTENKSSSAYTEQVLETLVTLDDGWSLPHTGKLDVGTLWTTLQSTQFDTLEEKAPSGKTLQCGKSSTLEVLVMNKECETAMHPSEQGRATSAESGWRFQTLAKEASSDGKRNGKSLSVHTKQRQETLVALDDGWTSPETGGIDTETLWATQFDALNNDVEMIRRQDEMLNNLIDSGITRECTEDMNLPMQRGEMNAESGWQLHKTAEETSAHGNKVSCNREQSLERLGTLDDGWTPPDMEDLEQGILWGSLNSTWYNSPGKRDSMVTSCLNKISSRKLQARRSERDDTNVCDGAQKDADCNLFERIEGSRLCYDMHVEKDQRWTHSSQGHPRAWRVEDADCNGSSRGRDTRVSDRSGSQRDNSHSESLQVQASNSRRIDAGEGIERELGRSYSKESTMCQRKGKSRSDQRSFSSELNASPKNSGIRIAKEFMRSHSREPHKQDRCRIDQRSFSKEQKVSPKYSGKDREEEARRFHSRNGWKSISMEQKASPENAGKRTEDVRRSHSRNEQRSISREQKASPERAGIRTEREFNRSHSRNDRKAISREGKAILESTGERTEKEVRKSHSRRSISREGKASPESAVKGEVRGSHSRGKRGSISREQKVSLESAGERAEKEVKRSYSRNDRRSISRERKASPESHGEREVRRSHSRNDRRSISRERKAASESAGRRTEQEVRTSHSRNDWRSFSKERKASPGNAGKRTENEVRRSHSRRSNSKERKSSSKSAGRRIEEKVWKCHSRENIRSPPRERRTSPSSGTHRSFHRGVDDALRSRRERKDSSAYASPSSHRSFSRNFDNAVQWGSSKEGRWERRRYADNAAEKFSSRERGPSPSEGEIQPSRHILCSNESTLHGPQSSERGWTPPDSPLNFAPRYVSLDVAKVEKLDDPCLLSGMLRFEVPSSPQELLLHPGSPELVPRENYPELPPSPPLPFSAAPNHMKLPSPPPLPAETSTLCHIDRYVM